MRFYFLDVFAETKYAGNQLAVFYPEKHLSDAEMQRIAREIHFSETTFILSDSQENGGYAVRIFTPDVEIPFAGHPTLGTAYVIHRFFERQKSDSILLNYSNTSILVTVAGDIYTMSQDAPSFGMIYTDFARMAAMLNLSAHDIRTEYPVQVISTGLPSLVVPLNSIKALARCSISHALFKQFLESTFKCCLMLFVPTSETHIRARVFLDDTGFPEDPATGSANGNLAAYLLRYDIFGKDTLCYNSEQGVEMGRPSLLHVAASLHGGAYDIRVGGKVRLVATGEWE